MSDLRNTIPDPNTFTRMPGAMASDQGGGSNVDPGPDDNGGVSVEQALAEAKAAKEASDRRVAASRAEAEEAGRQRDAALGQAATANAGALSAREQAVDTAIAAHTAAVAQAREAIALGHANGDSQAVADAMERMADAKAELKLLGGQKQYVAAEKQRQGDPRQQQRQQAPQGHTVRTPGGEMAGVADGAKQWMDAHPRFYSDPGYYNHMVAAHSTIVADGMQEGTPAYFRALDDAGQRFERFEAFERGDLAAGNGADDGRQQMNNGGRVDPYAHQRVQQPRPQNRPSGASVGATPSRGAAPAYQQNNNGQVDPMAIARHIGPQVTVDDLRQFARSNGYARGRQDATRIGADGKPAVFESDEAAFNGYLKEHQAIIDAERRGEETGLKYDSVYR